MHHIRLAMLNFDGTVQGHSDQSHYRQLGFDGCRVVGDEHDDHCVSALKNLGALVPAVQDLGRAMPAIASRTSRSKSW